MTQDRRITDKHPARPLDWENTEPLAGQQWRAPAAPASAAAAPLLTDERIAELNREAQDQGISGVAPSIYLARAIEAEVQRRCRAQRTNNEVSRDAEALKEMEARKDAAYYERNQVVAALAKCFPSGVARTAIEGWSEDWHGCAYIDLPTGQASWHFHDSQAHLFAGLPPYAGEWDGHDTIEKYHRLACLAATPAPAPAGGDARDAARYRWLRERWVAYSLTQNLNGLYRRREKLDAAIDAAMTPPVSSGVVGEVKS